MTRIILCVCVCVCVCVSSQMFQSDSRCVISSSSADAFHYFFYDNLSPSLKSSFRVYSADAGNTNGDAPYLGVILKKPKSAATEIFTDADAFEVDFPKDATADQKGILIGMSIFINSVFFEGDTSSGGDA